MGCCHHYLLSEGNESIFTVDFNPIKYGPGALEELPFEVGFLGLSRVALFTDSIVRNLEPVQDAIRLLQAARLDFEIYDEVSIEPTDQSFLAAARFATEEGPFDGFVSIGGGSVIDTCKAANLYSTHPAEFLDYVNAPVGEGIPIPGELKPHIACPTTSGTGSECTGIAVFDLLSRQVKTGIASARLKPARAVIDPRVTASLPATVVAASGFDVLCHALESYTAMPYTQRPRSEAGIRPLSQGSNPYSDMGCREAIRLTGEYLVRAVSDERDDEARHGMMLAATLAGIAFGNSGVHIPHGMSYSVAGLVRDYCPDGYPAGHPLVPHGISVIVNAPAAFRFTGPANHERHLEAGGLMGADIGDAGPAEAGEALSAHLENMMRVTGMPNGISQVGYDSSDIGNLADGAFMQQRLLGNAPCEVTHENLRQMYRDAIRYW
ncbi:MAG: iron-containing alcohol dehydrogenase [Acidiferrobacterales bacterium]|nr:iron-containing alcohol dehydrogenase [Acidiferrobacterales bacterium]